MNKVKGTITVKKEGEVEISDKELVRVLRRRLNLEDKVLAKVNGHTEIGYYDDRADRYRDPGSSTWIKYSDDPKDIDIYKSLSTIAEAILNDNSIDLSELDSLMESRGFHRFTYADKDYYVYANSDNAIKCLVDKNDLDKYKFSSMVYDKMSSKYLDMTTTTFNNILNTESFTRFLNNLRNHIRITLDDSLDSLLGLFQFKYMNCPDSNRRVYYNDNLNVVCYVDISANTYQFGIRNDDRVKSEICKFSDSDTIVVTINANLYNFLQRIHNYHKSICKNCSKDDCNLIGNHILLNCRSCTGYTERRGC